MHCFNDEEHHRNTQKKIKLELYYLIHKKNKSVHLNSSPNSFKISSYTGGVFI